MSDNVVSFTGFTRLDIDPKRLLQNALDNEGLTEVVILGYTSSGNEFLSSSRADGSSILWHLERAKLKLLRMGDE